jgi:signal transduction histidine kinase
MPSLTSDPRLVRQIVLNLAANAIKYTHEGSVTLAVRPESSDGAERVGIEVADTGIGIAPDDLQRIFDEFEQVRPEGRGDSITRGAGLGLTVAGRLARLLGGEVRAASRVGSGSRFELVLPTEAPVAEPEAPRGEAPAGAADATAAVEENEAPVGVDGGTAPG